MPAIKPTGAPSLELPALSLEPPELPAFSGKGEGRGVALTACAAACMQRAMQPLQANRPLREKSADETSQLCYVCHSVRTVLLQTA